MTQDKDDTLDTLRDLAERTMRENKFGLDAIEKLSEQVTQQSQLVDQLQATVEALRAELKSGALSAAAHAAGEASESDPDLQSQAKNKAEAFAATNGYAQRQVIVGAFANNEWTFELTPADLEQNETLVILCEGRAGEDDGDFIVLEIPSWFITQPLMGPFGDVAGQPLTLRLSADANRFLHTTAPVELELHTFRADTP